MASTQQIQSLGKNGSFCEMFCGVWKWRCFIMCMTCKDKELLWQEPAFPGPEALPSTGSHKSLGLVAWTPKSDFVLGLCANLLFSGSVSISF